MRAILGKEPNNLDSSKIFDDMQTIAIAGNLRTDLGKKATKAVRRNNDVPCVMYGGEENKHFSASAKAFRHLVYTPDFKIVEVTLDGKSYKAILKNVQFHPVSDSILHADFVELVPEKLVRVEVPIKIDGVAPGVKQGGALMLKMRRINIEATPENIVDKVSVDVSHVDLGQSVRVRDIKEMDGVTVLSALSNPIASVEVPRALRSAEASAEEAGAEGAEAGAEVAAEAAE